MPIHRTFDKTLKAEFWICDENLERMDIYNATRDMFADKGCFKELRFLFTDFTHARNIGTNTQDVPMLVEYDKSIARTNYSLCIAVVAPKDLMFGLGRMWQALIGILPWPTSICRTRAEAAQWLIGALEDIKDPGIILNALDKIGPCDTQK